MPEALLSTAGVTVRFGGLLAVDGVDFDVHAGELVGIIGPNGAGKTTFFHTLSGVLGLTTVRQDVAGQGTAAARLLLRALTEGDDSAEQIVLPTELVVRESTGPPPA